MSRRTPILLLSLIALPLFSGCASVKKAAVHRLADTLAASGTTFTGDEDPELIRDALPFALKTHEIVLADAPEHQGLLLATCQNFTTYTYGFVQLEADRLELTSFRAARDQRRRAVKLYLRARDYCLRAFDLRFPGQGSVLRRDPQLALADATADDVRLLQWTSLSWGAAIALALDQPEIVIDTPVARALLEKAIELDETYDDGALHDSMISVEGLPETMGGSPERARRHYRRALELNGGTRAGTYVSLAESVSVKAQDRKEFAMLLDKALAVDVEARPSERLVNIIQQQRARLLLDRIDELFLDDFSDEEELEEENG